MAPALGSSPRSLSTWTQSPVVLQPSPLITKRFEFVLSTTLLPVPLYSASRVALAPSISVARIIYLTNGAIR